MQLAHFTTPQYRENQINMYIYILEKAKLQPFQVKTLFFQYKLKGCGTVTSWDH